MEAAEVFRELSNGSIFIVAGCKSYNIYSQIKKNNDVSAAFRFKKSGGGFLVFITSISSRDIF